MEPLIEVDFDSGTEYYSRTGIRAPHAFYQPLITSFGGIKREISLVPGEYRAAVLDIEFNNASGVFSHLRNAEAWRNRSIRAKMGNPDIGFSDFVTIFQGKIESWALNSRTARIQAVDTIQFRLRRPIDFVIDGGFFHRLPDETPRELAPVVIGDVSQPGGAVPAYLVEPAIEIAVYRYLAAQGTAKSIDEVYAYGTLVDPGDYAISYGLGPNGRAVTFIDFDNDPRDTLTGYTDVADATEPHVSWNGSGETDDETVSGSPINNGAEQLERVLLINGFDASEIDSSSVALAADALNQKQIQGVCVIASREATLESVVREFAQSFNLQIFATNEGRVGITAPDPAIDEAAVLPKITAAIDVQRNSFEVEGPVEVAATLNASYGYSWYAGTFLNQLQRTNPQQVGALGEDLALNSEHRFLADAASMREVADIKLFFLREGRQVVRINIPPYWHQQLDLGDAIRLTHFAGVGEERIFRVIEIGLQESRTSIATRLRLVDLQAEPFFSVPPEDFSVSPTVYSDRSRVPFHRGRLRLWAS